MDGVDAAILDSDGESVEVFAPTHFEPYGREMRAALREAKDRAASLPTAGPLATGLWSAN